MIIRNKDKNSLELEREYWTFFYEFSHKGNRLINYTGIFKVKMISKNNSISDWYIAPEQLKKFPQTLRHNILHRLSWYGCDFYESEREAKDDHDANLLQHINNLSVEDRERIEKKLFTKIVRDDVAEAKKWYTYHLSPTEQLYVKILKGVKL